MTAGYEVELREDGADTLIPLRVTPKSGKNAVVGVKNGLLLVTVRAAPTDGDANQAVIATLSQFLGCAKSQISLVSGLKNREKTVRVTGQRLEQVKQHISDLN